MMSNSYSMEYGYKSLIYPARMFKTREDAQAFDDVESRSALTSQTFNRRLLEMIANGNPPEDAEETARVVLAAMRWIVNAADEAENAKRIAEWKSEQAKELAQQASE